MVHLTNRILTMVNRLGSRDKFQNEKWSLRLTKYKEKIPKMILDQTYPTPRRMTSLLNKSLSAFFSRFLKAFSKSDLVPRLRAFNVREEWVLTKFSHQPFCSHLYLFRIVGGVQCTLFFSFLCATNPSLQDSLIFYPVSCFLVFFSSTCICYDRLQIRPTFPQIPITQISACPNRPYFASVGQIEPSLVNWNIVQGFRYFFLIQTWFNFPPLLLGPMNIPLHWIFKLSSHNHSDSQLLHLSIFGSIF